MFFLGETAHISGLCHSIVRGELYNTCPLSCRYCYAKWYREEKEGENKKIFKLINLLKDIDLPITPVRFSTLSDPLLKPRFFNKVMKLILKYEIPIIINTKLYRREVIDTLKELSDLCVLQVSIPSLTQVEELEKVPVEDRFKLIEELSDYLPIAVRLQPFIPGISDKELENFFKRIELANLLIVEFLRVPEEELSFYKKFEPSVSWEKYLPKANLLTPSLSYKIKILTKVRELCNDYKIKLTTCKEGLFNFHDNIDCCGFEFLKVPYKRRATLYDAYTLLKEKKRVEIEEFFKYCEKRFLSGKTLEEYPKWYAKPFIKHEKRLRKLLMSEVLNYLTPLIKVENSHLTLSSFSPIF
ncbi:radical SAM protein [Methanocaldococcus infernus]